MIFDYHYIIEDQTQKMLYQICRRRKTQRPNPFQVVVLNTLETGAITKKEIPDMDRAEPEFP